MPARTCRLLRGVDYCFCLKLVLTSDFLERLSYTFKIKTHAVGKKTLCECLVIRLGCLLTNHPHCHSVAVGISLVWTPALVSLFVEAILSCDSFVAATAKLFHAVLKKLDVGAEKSGKHVERIARTAAGQRLSDSNIKLILSWGHVLMARPRSSAEQTCDTPRSACVNSGADLDEASAMTLCHLLRPAID